MPDFSRSVVNIASTLAEFLGCPNDKPVLPVLKAELEKGYKNVVFLIFDGLGVHPLEVNLEKESFFRRNVKQILTSVFPSTTTNATTSMFSNLYPMEHGWFGWSLYFDELGRSVDIFPEVDSATREPVEEGYVRRVLPVEAFYRHANTPYAISAVVPEYWHREERDRVIWHAPEEAFAHISEICRHPGKQFVYAYLDQPDAAMHRFGVTSPEARGVIEDLNARTEELYRELDDTLFIVASDHGQVDIGGWIELYRDEEIARLLACPQYLEARAAAFRVKEGCAEEFETLFTRKYGADFTLFKTKTLIEAGCFGPVENPAHAKLLGDYIAVGTTDKTMRLTPGSHSYLGHHGSVTAEMDVALILAGRGKEPTGR